VAAEATAETGDMATDQSGESLHIGLNEDQLKSSVAVQIALLRLQMRPQPAQQYLI
jgi:hypothetical protein